MSTEIDTLPAASPQVLLPPPSGGQPPLPERRQRRIMLRRVAALAGVGAVITISAASVHARPSAALRPSPVGTRPVPDPKINALAETVTATAGDQQRGYYLHATTRTWYRQHGVVTVEQTETWQGRDGEGIDRTRAYELPGGGTNTPGALKTADFTDVPPHDDALVQWLPAHRPQPDTGCSPGSLIIDGILDASSRTADALRSIGQWPLSASYRADCRAALLRTVALLNGTVLDGPVTDPYGRPGIAVDLTAEGIARRLIFQPGSGVLLAYLETMIADLQRIEAPGLRLCVVFVTADRTDTIPPQR